VTRCEPLPAAQIANLKGKVPDTILITLCPSWTGDMYFSIWWGLADSDVRRRRRPPGFPDDAAGERRVRACEYLLDRFRRPRC
jgi:hypothetical protein